MAGHCQPSIKVLYRAADRNDRTAIVSPQFDVFNGSSVAVPLSQLKIRYYYTVDAAAEQVGHCYYAAAECSNVRLGFGNAAGTSSDRYFEVAFTGTALLQPGNSSGKLELGFNKLGFIDYDQTNDWSFDPTAAEFQENYRSTLFRNGVLIWGTPP